MSVGFQLGTEHDAKVTTLSDRNLYHHLHDSEVIELAEGDRPILLDTFYAALGVLLGVLPALPGVVGALVRGSVDVGGAISLMLAAASLAVMLATGPQGFAARRRVREQLRTIRERPKIPISAIPDLDFRRA